MTPFISLRLCIDFGLVILIWMVQRIVYPSFLHYSKEQLVEWHKQYTPAIASIVTPLMIIQLGIAVYQCIHHITLFSLGYMGIILSLWTITFYTFVPLHRALGTQEFIDDVPRQLVGKNWRRTLLWTLLFIISVWQELLS